MYFYNVGPYVKLNMNPSSKSFKNAHKDAMFISPHKFVGGPGTPGYYYRHIFSFILFFKFYVYRYTVMYYFT